MIYFFIIIITIEHFELIFLRSASSAWTFSLTPFVMEYVDNAIKAIKNVNAGIKLEASRIPNRADVLCTALGTYPNELTTHPQIAPPKPNPALRAKTTPAKTNPVARRLFCHSEKSATSPIIAQRRGIVSEYAPLLHIFKINAKLTLWAGTKKNMAVNITVRDKPTKKTLFFPKWFAKGSDKRSTPKIVIICPAILNKLKPTLKALLPSLLMIKPKAFRTPYHQPPALPAALVSPKILKELVNGIMVDIIIEKVINSTSPQRKCCENEKGYYKHGSPGFGAENYLSGPV